MPIYDIATLEDQISAFPLERRFQTWITTRFSVVALLLAAFGVFGLVEYSVSRRTPEIGIRVALGARRQDIFLLVMGQGIGLAIIGIGIGTVAARC